MAPVSLIPCGGCGRSFNAQALEKHARICKKVFGTKRKEFNMKANRMVDTEQKQLMREGARREKQMKKSAMPGNQKWRMQSMQFRLQLKAGRVH